MKERLIIENFGPIKEIEFDDIRPLTVLIGESGSGKSTIMKILVLFRYLYKIIVIRSYLENSGIIDNKIKINFEEYIKRNGFVGYFSENTKIQYSRGKYSIEYYRNIFKSDITIANEDLSLDKMSFIADKRNNIPNILQTGNNSNDFYLNETFLDFKRATSDFSSINLECLGVKLKKKRDKQREKYVIQNIDKEKNKYEIAFSDSSSGMQNVLPLITIMNYFITEYNLVKAFNRAIVSYLSDSDIISKFKPELDIGKINYRNLFFHIEEPELSLYPKTQLDVMSEIVKKCFRHNKSFIKIHCIMTTHSPYIVNYLNLLIKRSANKIDTPYRIDYPDVAVYEVSDGYISSLKIDDESRIIDTRILSDPISNIYEEYDNLTKA